MRKSIQCNPSFSVSYMFLAAALALLGHIDAAEAAAAQVLALRPGFSFGARRSIPRRRSPSNWARERAPPACPSSSARVPPAYLKITERPEAARGRCCSMPRRKSDPRKKSGRSALTARPSQGAPNQPFARPYGVPSETTGAARARLRFREGPGETAQGYPHSLEGVVIPDTIIARIR